MSNAKTDQNDVKTWLAYNETTGLVEPVRVDPVLNAILIYAVTPDVNIPAALNRAKHDGDNTRTGNAVPTITALNSTTGLIEAMRCGIDGSLLVIEVS